ncbi:MAG: hypothetical protein IPF73_14800 [Betaproteobacteria bacterium]|nr:hypothetical protein [Betaproteobacteria bacterium]
MTDARPPSPAPGYRVRPVRAQLARPARTAGRRPAGQAGRARLRQCWWRSSSGATGVVSKHELMDLVWPKLVVEENNLQAQVVALHAS